MFDVTVGTAGKLWSGTATNGISGTSSTSVATSISATESSTGKIAVTHFSGSSDIACLYTIESPAGTVLWQKYRAGTNNDVDERFDPPIVGGRGATVLFKAALVASSKTQVNATGFEIGSN